MKSSFVLLRSVWVLFLVLIHYGVGYSQTPGRIPQAIRVSREGRLPLPDLERQFLLSDLTVNDQKEVFPVPPCLSGRYYVGLQLVYDLGDRNTTQPWSADLEIDFLQGNNLQWTRPLQVAMGSQTLVTTVFHDTLVSCDGNYRITLKTKTVSPLAPQQQIYLKVLLFKHLEEVFNPATPLALNVVYANGNARIQWNHPGTATADYDLEWVFIEDHEPFNGTTAAAAFSFREPVRVSTAQRYYTHPLFYPKGKVWYRVRAVGYNPAYPTHRIPGQWFYAADAGTTVNNAQADQNWQRQTSFTENGQYKHGISYLDGSLRARQQLTNLSSEKRTLVGESLYDYEGRKSVEMMVAPAPDSLLTFRAGFRRFASQDATVAALTGPQRHKFHYDNRRKPNSTLSATVGAGQYYSGQNPFTGSLHRDYIPQAQGYVYRQSEYLNDGTGRVSRQGGVGARFRVDSDSTVRQYYGSAVSEELIRLFGSNVGVASHYRKNLAVDANGQVSVTYLDQEGRTLATALAGDKPANLQALSSFSAAMPAERTVNAGTKNQLREGVSRTTHTLLNTSPNTRYTFDYDLSASAASVAQMGCMSCRFDLKITLSDPEGKPMDLSAVVGNESVSGYSFERGNLTAASCAAPSPVNHSTFSLLLPEIGDYTLVKTLTPRALSFEQLANQVRASTQVQQEIQQIRDSYSVQPEDCAICTESCPEAGAVIESVIGEVASRNCDNLYQEMVAYYRQRYGQTGEEPYEVPQDSLRAHPNYCAYSLCQKDRLSAVFDTQLARVDSWEAAVSQGYDQALALDPFFNNAALSGWGHKASAQARLNDVVLGTVPFDSNGDGIADGSPTYRGTLAQVTDPSNTQFYIGESGQPSAQGKHLLYLDLMGRRSQMSPAAYQSQLSQQRWSLYKSFYLEAKRKTRLEIPAYQNCAPAKAGLLVVDGLPQTPAAIAAFGDAKGASGPVGNATLEMSLAVIQNSCPQKLSATDSTAIAGHLRTYFNGKPANYFRLILSEDLISNPSLVAIGTLLQAKGCSLNAVAVVNPIACAKDTTLYLPKLSSTLPVLPPPPVVTPPAPTPPITPLPPATLQQQYTALWDFYQATGGANWTNRTGWATANPQVLQSVSGWYGLSVNSAGFVTGLNMSSNNLNGSIPSSIRQLTHLTNLSIRNSVNITGPIPAEIGGLVNLTALVLTNNRLSGAIPASLGLLTNLTSLQLTSNQLTGPIPSELGTLNTLLTLALAQNFLTGSIPASLGSLSQLRSLQLFNNSLSGSVPVELAGLANLITFSVSNNGSLRGNLPPGLVAIPTLTDLSVGNNGFSFENLLYSIQNKRSTTTFSYAPQDSVDVAGNVSTPPGQGLTLAAQVDRNTSPASLYQWFKVVNGVSTALNLPSVTGHTYTTPALTPADMGTRYYYQITNPSAPALSLTSRMRRLVAYDGWEVKTCLAYDQANPTLLQFTSVPSLSQAVALCLSNAALEDSILTELAIGKLVEIRASAAYNSYREQCLWGLGEKLQYRYASREHHYTLYYYDQAGNLVQTVPPAGVQPLSEGQVAAFMAGNRTDPGHTLRSQYQYNSLNALVGQKTPDGGQSQFYYNEKGQMRLSQNAEQAKVKLGKQAYSYTRYDEQGRTTEVGELSTAQALTSAQTTLQDSLASSTFPLTGRGDYQLSDRTLTFYDFARPGFQGVFAQQYLRSRVSWSAVLEKGRTDTLASYYRYDVHGNVRSLLQAVPGLSHKRTDYRYDLVSGKVNYVFYQYGKEDELTHRYQYDADNRLTGVYTSSDGFLWNKEAKYQYYLHGPLGRMELGEYRVQGQDYFYTLQGWIKGVNRPYVGDPGKDGIQGSTVGKDAFAYTLGYYDGDYQPINASLNYADNRDQLWSRLQGTLGYSGLYNGNIAWMVTDLPKLGQLANSRAKGMQGMLYGYDQLNRIVQSRSLTNYNASSGFAARASTSSAAYDEDYSYDGNGNLLSLQRRDEAGALQDDFNYQYYAGSNKLREVKAVTRDKTISSGSVRQDNIRYRSLTLTGSSYVSAGRLVEVKALEKIQLRPNFRSAQGTDFWAHLVDDGTYQYDGIGNLILDQDEGVKISWTPYGKIREVSVKGDSLVTRFRYDAMGNRVEKRVLLADTTYALTRYIRDALGDVMAIYKDTTLTEQPLYGSSRLGEYRGGVGVGMRKLGRRHYELSNHLGNVLAVVSDNVGMQTDSVWATVASTSDFYPFGLTMKGRTWGDTTGYKPRYGFGGHEKDDEIKGSGNHLSFGDFGYDPSLGRRWNIDPRAKRFPQWSPYAYSYDSPIQFNDPDGMMPQCSTCPPGGGDPMYYVAAGFGQYFQAIGSAIDKAGGKVQAFFSFGGEKEGKVGSLKGNVSNETRTTMTLGTTVEDFFTPTSDNKPVASSPLVFSVKTTNETKITVSGKILVDGVDIHTKNVTSVDNSTGVVNNTTTVTVGKDQTGAFIETGTKGTAVGVRTEQKVSVPTGAFIKFGASISVGSKDNSRAND